MKKTLLSLLAFAAVNVYAQVDVTATAGTSSATYTTLKDAFDAVNAGTHQGAVLFSITANTTETASAVLNASANYSSLKIQPATGVTAQISGAISANPLVRILGSNVTIDGSNSGGSSRDLTFSNTSTSAPQVLVMGSATATAPLTNVVLMNTNFINGVNTSSAVIAHDGAAGSVGGYFSNITFKNNTVQKAYIGVFINAAIAGGNGMGVKVENNDLTASGANALRLCGIYLQGVDGGLVSNNQIANFETTSVEVKRGIWFATGTINSIISGNTINNLGYSATSGAGGIAAITVTTGTGGANTAANVKVERNLISNLNSGGTGPTIGVMVSGVTSGVQILENKISKIKNSNATGYGAEGIALLSSAKNNSTFVVNNFVSDVSARGYSASGYLDNGYGIHVNDGSGYHIYFNTVHLSVNQTNAGRPAAFGVAQGVVAAAIDLRNNVLVNTQTYGPGYAIHAAAGKAVFSNIDNNNYYSATVLGLIGTGTASADLAALKVDLGGNEGAINVAPNFVGGADLHVVSSLASNAWKGKGTPIAGYTTDIDGQQRHGLNPDMGADEFLFFDPSMATTENAGLGKVSVYPNPTTDLVNFRTTKAISKIEIYDLNGKKVGEQTFRAGNATVSMRALKSGVYMLKVQVGEHTEVLKVIKK